MIATLTELRLLKETVAALTTRVCVLEETIVQAINSDMPAMSDSIEKLKDVIDDQDEKLGIIQSLVCCMHKSLDMTEEQIMQIVYRATP
jgi:hypothetical protein